VVFDISRFFFVFGRLGLKLPILALFGEFFPHYWGTVEEWGVG